MATSSDIIKPALFSIGAASDINRATPEMLKAAFNLFVAMMQKFEVDGMKSALGTDFTENPPTDIATEINNSVGSDLALINVFAIWVAPIFQIIPSDTQKALATMAMNTIRSVAYTATAPEWPETLPIGAGNRKGPKGRVYFPVPEYTQARQNEEGST